ncbi:MAG TPA: LLM class flavin-dependent oxidoreductase [Candidatus Limnocylindrales bacterium]|nr:LLM class flavin-dependent oxidoreductase [Candidatus Limnocylindrales bacterium]
MNIGLALGGSLADVARGARVAEEAGFESVWVAELERSAFVQAAAAIAATSSITVGTAAALAFPRSPTITAMEAWDLDELSGGRFVLGLGTQVKRVLEGRFSVAFEAPADRLAEYASAVRAVWTANRGEVAADGRPTTHEGRFYRITMPTFHGEPRPARRDVPILFAAVGPVLARTAGSVADGLLGHPLASARYLADVVAPAISAGVRGADRDPGACPITAMAITSIGADREEARRRARLQVAFYATTRTYRGILELHGRGELIGQLRRAFVRQERERMAELIDDELLDEIALAGSADEAIGRVDGWSAVPGLERLILAPPWYGVPESETARQIEGIVGAFGRSGVRSPGERSS